MSMQVKFDLVVCGLVYEHALSVSLLQQISPLHYRHVQNELKGQRQLYNSFLLIDLGRISQNYIVR